MAKKSKDQINLTKDDFKNKRGKVAPSGTYSLRFVKGKCEIVPRKNGGGNQIKAQLQITGDSKGKKTEHAKVTIFEYIQPDVGWKVAQILAALGVKKMSLTLQDLLKLIDGKEVRGVLRVERDEEFGDKNKVVQYLPPAGENDDEEDDDDEDEEEEDNDSESDDEDEDEDEDDDEDEDEDDDEDDDEEEDSDDEEDEDEEEEEETPKRGRKAPAKKATAKKTAAKKAAKKTGRKK